MSESGSSAFQGLSENEIWSAISAFEQILDVVPDDVDALDALTQAYDIIGDGERARNYLLRLVRACLEQGDVQKASGLAERLKRYGPDDAEAAALLQRISQLSPADRTGPSIASPTRGEPRREAEPAPIDAELALAWRLHSAGLLSAEEYAGAVRDLSDIASRKEPLTLSVLHVLHDRQFPKLDEVLAYMARETRTPVVPIMAFEMPESCQRLLPVEFMVRKGVAPFSILSNEPLVALLNPYAETVRAETTERAGRVCHFYLTWPAEFDAWIERLRQSLQSNA